MLWIGWFSLQIAALHAAILPPPWADPNLNPCATQPGGWLKLYWPADGQCYRIFQRGPPCPQSMELSPGPTGAECRCPPGQVQIDQDSPCYKIHSKGPCSNGQYLAPLRDDTRGRWGICKDVPQCSKTDDLFWPGSSQCFTEYTRGPCPIGQLLIKDNVTGLAECKCEPSGPLSRYYWSVTKTCHQFYTKGPCLEKGSLFLPGPKCGCHSGLTNYHQTTEQCYELGSSGPCKTGQIFTGQTGCTCKVDHVPWYDGHCYRAYTRGPCPSDQLVSTNGTCQHLPCPRGKLYFPESDGCYRVGVTGPCGKGQLVLFEQSVRAAVEGISYRGMCGFRKMIPEFINKDFVEKVWRAYFHNEDVTAEECDIQLVGAKGDNYSSVMCRAKSTICKNNKRFVKQMVIKTMPTTEGAKKYVSESKAFEKEIEMLEKILPSIEQLLKTIRIDVKLAARLYYKQMDPNPIIAMEDLTVDGYATRTRFIGLDIDECFTTVKALAEYHAASMVLLKNKEISDSFIGSIWTSQNRENMEHGLIGGLENIIKKVDNYSDKKWSHKVEKLLSNQLNNFFEMTDTQKIGRPMVLNHGDLWVNNLMFRSSTDIRFVDLQLSWINSPVFDLQYFIFTSMKQKDRPTQWEKVLQVYHKRFTEVTQLLKLNINYSYDDLMDDFKDNILFGFTVFYFVFPIIKAPPEDAIDTSKFDDDVWKNNPIYNNKDFWACFVDALPIFERFGLL